ncbi:MAG: sensor histidine kinase [Flavobacterium sp.]|nr:sensor histidine kinase [Flavobacterium sp.]
MKQLHVLIFLFFTLFAFSQNPVIDSLQRELKKKQSERGKFQTLMLLCEEYSKDNPNQALYYAKLCLINARSVKNDTFLAVAYNSLATTYQNSSELDTALLYNNKSLAVRKKLKDSVGIADSYNNIGVTYDMKGQFDAALQHYFLALTYYDKKKDIDKLAMTYTNIGIIYKTQKEYTKALDYYKKSYDLYVEAKSDFGITVSSGNIGSVLINFKRYKESLKYSEMAEKGYRKLGYESYAAYPLSTIAVVYDSLHDFPKANAAYVKSIALHEQYQNWYEVSNTYNAYANCLVKQKKYDESIKMSNKGVAASKKAEAYLLEVEAYHNLAKANAELGHFSDAYKYSNLYTKGKDSLFEAEKTKTIFELEAKYETEKKEKLLLKKEAEAKQKNVLLLVLAISIFFAILIGYLIFRQQKLKNRQQEQEFELKSAISVIETQNKLQEQRLSISRDLHDNIGAQLTFIISSVDNIKYAFNLENTKLDGKLQSISKFTKSTIVELRDTIWAMNSNAIGFEDLQMRIMNFIDNAKMAKEDIEFHFEIDEKLSHLKLSSVTGMNLYRVTQEAINNAIKYANASKIAIDVRENSGVIEVIISDNGSGFDEESIIAGNGLHNMRKRMKDIGGELAIASTIGKGTTIKIAIEKPKKNNV